LTKIKSGKDRFKETTAINSDPCVTNKKKGRLKKLCIEKLKSSDKMHVKKELTKKSDRKLIESIKKCLKKQKRMLRILRKSKGERKLMKK